MDAALPFAISRLSAGAGTRAVEDVVAVEEPLEIRVEGRSVAVVMRTPGHDRELAAGFLLTEGIIKTARDIFDITSCVTGGSTGNVIDIALANPRLYDPSKFTRHVFTSSSCGICGKTSVDAVMKRRPKLHDEIRVSSKLIGQLPARLSRKQTAFKATGGLHACALFDVAGKLGELREDVGRHNALDKLIGHALLAQETPLAGRIVLLSGRASFEIIQKALAAGIPIVAAVSAPSSLAVELARDSNQTLIGFLRPPSFNIYTHVDRVIL